MEQPKFLTATVESRIELSLENQRNNILKVFELYPELGDKGTPEKYEEYLKTVFPGTKIPNILFHATKTDFNEFDPAYMSKGNLSFGDGFYFTDNMDTHKSFRLSNKVMPVVVNLQNIYFDSFEAKQRRELPAHNKYVNSHETLQEVKNQHNDFIRRTYDGVVATYKGINEIVLFDPKNIHILGSQKDIENFESFVERG